MAPRKKPTVEELTARAKAQWEERWAEKGKPTKDEQNASLEVKLRSKFWGHADAKPRCYTCRKSQSTVPATAPLKFNEKGELVSEILPCGCEYELSMLEMWLVDKGLFRSEDGEKRTDIPKTIGKHRGMLLFMFEACFGTFSIDKMLNISNARVDACKKQAKVEAKGNLQLSYCAPYESDDD